jgi:hypothetical protein
MVRDIGELVNEILFMVFSGGEITSLSSEYKKTPER